MPQLDQAMIDAPACGSALNWRKQIGEKFYRYVCLDDFLDEIPGADTWPSTIGSYLVNPLGGPGGNIVPIAMLPGSNMLVVAEYNGQAGRSGTYVLSCTTTGGQVREIILRHNILP